MPHTRYGSHEAFRDGLMNRFGISMGFVLKEYRKIPTLPFNIQELYLLYIISSLFGENAFNFSYFYKNDKQLYGLKPVLSL